MVYPAPIVFITPSGANITSIDDARQLLTQPEGFVVPDLMAINQDHPNTNIRTFAFQELRLRGAL